VDVVHRDAVSAGRSWASSSGSSVGIVLLVDVVGRSWVRRG
jgi:hypothetical protein